MKLYKLIDQVFSRMDSESLEAKKTVFFSEKMPSDQKKQDGVNGTVESLRR